MIIQNDSSVRFLRPHGPEKELRMKYYCDLCGFLYDESVSGPMPDDYSCPLCGAKKDHFEPEEP